MAALWYYFGGGSGFELGVGPSCFASMSVDAEDNEAIADFASESEDD